MQALCTMTPSSTPIWSFTWQMTCSSAIGNIFSDTVTKVFQEKPFIFALKNRRIRCNFFISQSVLRDVAIISVDLLVSQCHVPNVLSFGVVKDFALESWSTDWWLQLVTTRVADPEPYVFIWVTVSGSGFVLGVCMRIYRCISVFKKVALKSSKWSFSLFFTF